MLVATGGDASARAAKAVILAISIVFVTGGDRVEAGLVESFNRPGGNATGCVILSNCMESKRLALLHEIVPGVSLFGALLNPNFPPAAGQLRDLEAAAPKIGRRVFIAKASNDAELDVAFAAPPLFHPPPTHPARHPRLIKQAQKEGVLQPPKGNLVTVFN